MLKHSYYCSVTGHFPVQGDAGHPTGTTNPNFNPSKRPRSSSIGHHFTIHMSLAVTGVLASLWFNIEGRQFRRFGSDTVWSKWICVSETLVCCGYLPSSRRDVLLDP